MNINMNEPNSNNGSNNEILEKIKSGQLKMKPKLYFASKTILFIAGAFLAFLAIIFLISFVIFVLKGRGAWFLTDYGWPGIKIFLLSFPWILFAISIIFVAMLEVLIHHFGFAYRRPMIYSIFGVIAIVTGGGIWLALTPLHSNALKSALQSNLPMAGALYRNYCATPIDNLYEGNVIDQTDDINFSVQTLEGQRLEIQVPTSTRDKFIQQGGVQKDDSVMIVGEKNGSKVRVFGIHKFSQDDQPVFRQCHQPPPGPPENE